MGQQQLLLIVIGTVIVGIAIVLGVAYFRSSAIDTKRENLIADCTNLASIANTYYMRPKAMGGGGNSFENWTIPAVLVKNANGDFTIESIDANSVLIRAIGNEVVTSGDNVEVTILIEKEKFKIEIIH